MAKRWALLTLPHSPIGPSAPRSFGKLLAGFVGDIVVRAMKAAVFSLSNQYKVLRSVVFLVVIHVMDYLVRFKNATVRLFPYKAMFSDVTVPAGIRMFGGKYLPILAILASGRLRARLGVGQPARVMAVDIHFGETNVPAAGNIRTSDDLGLAAAAAMTEAMRRIIRWRSASLTFLAFEVSAERIRRAELMAGNIAKRCALRGDAFKFLSAATFTIHSSIIAEKARQVKL